MTSGIAILYLYLIGIIVCTIGFGVWVSLSEIFLKDEDAVLFFFIIITWPVWLFITAFVGVVFLFLFKPIMFLMFKSIDWCDRIMNWWQSKKEHSNDNKVI